MTDSEPSYIDYETFIDPSFSPAAFANTLVLATNDPSDTPLDLSTPLSRVLFDVQEVDTHIDTLTTKSALPIIDHTKDNAESSARILSEVEAQVASLTEGYKRLEKEVVERYEAAEQVRLVASRLVQTLRLGRSVQRCLQLGRQLEGQMSELGSSEDKRQDHRGMMRAANTLLSSRQLFSSPEVTGLQKIQVVSTLRSEVITPAERALVGKAQQTVREFSMSSLLASSNTAPSQGSTFAQTEDTKSRATSALTTLYLLSPTKATTTVANFEPSLLISSLQSYLQTALTSSLASLARALATLPTLERTLLEISARCQNIVALEALLESIKPPAHPLFEPATTSSHGEDTAYANFLQPLLRHLDTSSLPSYFWRTLAGQLSNRVQEILNRGGVSARTLRSNRERVRDMVRDCVDRGSRLPVNGLGGRKEGKVGNWEREAGVMTGSILNPLSR